MVDNLGKSVTKLKYETCSVHGKESLAQIHAGLNFEHSETDWRASCAISEASASLCTLRVPNYVTMYTGAISDVMAGKSTRLALYNVVHHHFLSALWSLIGVQAASTGCTLTRNL
eukprot:6173333-Pleurochrysis_carterae.AAC.3